MRLRGVTPEPAFIGLHDPSRDPGKPGTWAVLGLVSGLGFWFCYTSGMSLAACALTWLLLRGAPRCRELLWATLGGLVGLVPWFVYNLRFAFRGGVRILELFGLRDPIDPWVSQGAHSKLVGLLSYDLPVGLLVPLPGAVPKAAGVMVIVAVGGSLAVALGISLRRVGTMLIRGRARSTAPGDRELPVLHTSHRAARLPGRDHGGARLSRTRAIPSRRR